MQTLINSICCDNRTAYIFALTLGGYSVQYVVKGAGVVEEHERRDKQDAEELAFQFVRGAALN